MTATATPEREAVRIRYQTVRAMLDRDEAFGFALARLKLEPGDEAWFPGMSYRITGPCRITYERRDGRVRARIE